MATPTAEVVYIPENIDGKGYMNYQRFRLRVCICSGISMLIILSAAIALIMLILNVSMFLSKKYVLAEGDIRMISVSTAFCEEISLGEDAFERNLWILKSLTTRPQLQATNISAEIFISKRRYWYKGFYLLAGSAITVKAESDSVLKLFIFKDKKRLNEWIENNDDLSGIRGDKRNDKPTVKPTRISYRVNILESGNYFVLFKYFKGDKDYARIKFDLKIDRKSYDLSSSVYTCSAGVKKTCSGKLLFSSSEVGVLEIPEKSSGTSYLNNELIATWHCKPRIWFYLAVFLGPILVAFVVCLVFYYCFISRTEEKHLYRLAARRQQALKRASAAGHSISFSSRSLNGSMRGGPPSRTPSIRTNGNQSDRPSLQPVVTTMYTGSPVDGSEESGNGTDEESNANHSIENPTRKSSVDRISLGSREITVHRQASFSTFQSSEDEATTLRYPAKKSRDTNWRTVFDLQQERGKFAKDTNTFPRRNSSEELCYRGSGTLPCNCAKPEATGVSRRSSERLRDVLEGKRPPIVRKKHKIDHQDARVKIPNGMFPGNIPSRRYSSEELFHHGDYRQLNLLIAEPEVPLSSSSKGDGERSKNKKSRRACDGGKTTSLRRDGRGTIPNGTIPSKSPTRRNSSDELYYRKTVENESMSLPRDRGNTMPTFSSNNHLNVRQYIFSSKHASLPCLQRHPKDSHAWVPSAQNASSNFQSDEHVEEPQQVKMRAHSWRRREMGWTPRLSIVSESEV